MAYRRPSRFYYLAAQAASWVVAKFVFKRKFLRNEIKGKKGPFVVIANHEAALDFVNLIGATSRPMTFVISNSFFNTLPVKGVMERMGVIPKQQFQTATRDLKRMKEVIDQGESFVIYPAGLMCEDGLSTPIPAATYKFLKWLKADVYVARTSGSYFVMPKWAKGLRPGRTYMDIYQLFTKEELAQMDLDAIRERTDNALLFDAYREQETLRAKYKDNQNLEGLENVLYLCPHCGTEFSIQVRGRDTICCSKCGFSHQSDALGFLHRKGQVGKELRYISDWSRHIYEDMKQRITAGIQPALTAGVRIQMIDHGKNRFADAGAGELTLSRDAFCLHGQVDGQPLNISVEPGSFPSLPFSPGKYLEFQYGETIYRCVLDDGRLVMKFINMLKVFYALSRESTKQPLAVR